MYILCDYSLLVFLFLSFLVFVLFLFFYFFDFFILFFFLFCLFVFAESEKRETVKEESLNLNYNASETTIEDSTTATEKMEIKIDNTDVDTIDKEAKESPVVKQAESSTDNNSTMLENGTIRNNKLDSNTSTTTKSQQATGAVLNDGKQSSTIDDFDDTFPKWKNADTLHHLKAVNVKDDLKITEDDKTPAFPDDGLTQSMDFNNSTLTNSTTNYFDVNKRSRRGSGVSEADIDIDRLLDPTSKNSFSDSSRSRQNDDEMSVYSDTTSLAPSRMNSMSLFSNSYHDEYRNTTIDHDGIRLSQADARYFGDDGKYNDDDKGNGGGIKEETFEWTSERNLVRNCWYDPLVHDEMSDVGILRRRKHILSKNSQEKHKLSKETHLHSYYGVLWKKGESHNKWKQRYFELDWSKNDFKMKYYSDKSKKHQKGHINLKNAYMVSTRLEKRSKKQWTRITIWEPSREWELATDNATYVGYWVGVIDNAMNKVTQIVRNQLYAKKYIYITDKCIILQGWLRKSNPKGRGFKDRWWYLNTNLEKSPKLRYYEKDMSSKIGTNKIIKGYKGEIDVKKALHIGPCLEKNVCVFVLFCLVYFFHQSGHADRDFIVCCVFFGFEQMYDEFPLCIDIVTKDRTYHLVPNRLEQMELWLQTLRLFVPINNKKNFGNIFYSELQRKISGHKNQLAGPKNQNWCSSYCVLTARALYYFKSEESYHLYRRATLTNDGKNKVKFGSNEGIFEFSQGITFYELKGVYDGDRRNCFALVLHMEKNKRKVDVFQARSKNQFLEWEQNFKAMGIEHKAVPAVGNNLFA